MKTCFTIVSLFLAVNLAAQSGAPDSTFGGTGQVFTTINNSGIAKGVIILPDSEIVAIGSATLNSGDAFVIVRYTANGYLDGNFGSDGILSTHIGPSSAANAVVLQPDGKMVLAGKTINLSGSYDFALARFNNDGSLDSTFGVQGIVITDLGNDDEATAIMLQSDGKLVAGGFSKSSDSTSGVAMVRYTANGVVDNSFGTSGIVLTPVSLSAETPAPIHRPDFKLQADGKIVAVSTTYQIAGNDFIALRYNTDGTADNTFGANGETIVDFGADNDYGYAVYIQPDGKILLGGSSINSNIDSGYMALVRLNANGSLDNTFGSGGMVKSFATVIGSADVQSFAMQRDGNIIAAGTITPPAPGLPQFIIAKYTPAGVLNDSFGNGGYITTNFTDAATTGQSIALQSDGKIVMAGGSGQEFMLTRYFNFADSITADSTTAVDTTTGPSTGVAVISPVTESLIAYPNPTRNNVTVQYNLTNDDNVTIRLWNLSGQIVGTIVEDGARAAGAQKENVDMSDLENGYYMLTLYTSQGETALKLLKQ